MSLINQALKKAQRDRNPSRMGKAGDHGPAGMARTPGGGAMSGAGGLNLKIVIGVAVAFAVLVGLVVGLTVVLLGNSKSGPAMASEPAPAPALASTEAPEAPAGSPADPVITPEPNVEPDEPPTVERTVEAETGPSVVEELRRAREAAEAKAAAEAEAARKAEEAARAAEAKAAASPEPSRDVIEWLGAAKISGVRLAGEDSKVILNGKAYATGEVVNYGLGLKVLVIREKRVLFVDADGVKYMKAF